MFTQRNFIDDLMTMQYFDTFTGIGAGSLAIQSIIPNAECVGFSEIDKYSEAVYKLHFPNHKNFGDISKIDIANLPNFDLLIGGSPCQDVSRAKQNRQGLDGSRSGLFFKYLEILNVKKPKYFILENVNSMRKEDKDKISECVGIQPVMINSALVSAQQRKRLFWVGKLVDGKYEQVIIPQPNDRGILLKDILEKEVEEKYFLSDKEINYMNGDSGKYSDRYSFTNDDRKEKSNTLVANLYRGVPYNTIKVGHFNKGGQGDRVYSPDGKSVTLSANGGGRGAKTGLYIVESSDIRKLTPLECERLQTFPDNYTKLGIFDGVEKPISNSQRYKQLGNSFTVEVIKHILNNI